MRYLAVTRCADAKRTKKKAGQLPFYLSSARMIPGARVYGPSRIPFAISKTFSSIFENLLELYASCRVYPPKKTDGEFEWSEAIQNYKTPEVGNNSAN
jgi:hypothetical protein